jgi:competence protein ComEC
MTLLISFGIFFLMLPIVHTVFPMTTLYQLTSPFLSLLFSFFYPLSMLLHLLGIGNILDVSLLKLFTLESDEIFSKLPLSYSLSYLSLSFLAIYFKWLFYLLCAISGAFTIWLFSGFWV